jgi:EAL and modified HD-GYP domain-containing signal transduction protein
MHSYLGRQPIFDKQGDIFAYELLYRSCELRNEACFEDNTLASTRVIAHLIQSFGIKSVVGSKQGFINLDETMLFSDTLLLLPKEHICFEILEYTKVSLALYERVKYLHSLGYRFLLDDFDCTDTMIATYEALFPYIDIVKVDILAIGLSNLPNALAKIKKYDLTLLAEKIESFEVYTACKALPFTYFQGYFFEKPLIVVGKRLEPQTLNALRLINCIQHTYDMKEIAQRISSCPDIVYNLLRHINSGAYHFKHTITNITQMTTLLGHQKLLSWLGLFIYGSPNQQPFGEAVYNSAKFRAKMMEILATKHYSQEMAHKAFLVGSLSLVDVYFNISMEDFLQELHLDEEIKEALLFEKGCLGNLLWIAKEMNHSCEIASNLLCANICQEELYDACLEANIFVEESNQFKKDKS